LCGNARAREVWT